jgi:hypothetical protein
MVRSWRSGKRVSWNIAYVHNFRSVRLPGSAPDYHFFTDSAALRHCSRQAIATAKFKTAFYSTSEFKSHSTAQSTGFGAVLRRVRDVFGRLARIDRLQRLALPRSDGVLTVLPGFEALCRPRAGVSIIDRVAGSGGVWQRVVGSG